MDTFPLLPKVDCNKTQIKAWLDTYLKFYCIYIPYITCILKKTLFLIILMLGSGVLHVDAVPL